jgi:Na+-transporting NADH:ubiquinone oxidoreductase subunit NqrC
MNANWHFLGRKKLMDDSASRDIIRFGLASLIKIILFFFIVLIICSVFLITIGWILTMAFSEFRLFEATLIPLLIVGVASIMIGLISIWLRLGEIGYVLDPESELFDDADLYDEDYHFDEDKAGENELSSDNQRSAKIANLLKKNRNQLKTQNNAPESSDDY